MPASKRNLFWLASVALLALSLGLISITSPAGSINLPLIVR